MKTRVKFKLKANPSDIQIGYLVRDKKFVGGFRVMTADKKSCYTLLSLATLDKI